jgi:hypothetical protein
VSGWGKEEEEDKRSNCFGNFHHCIKLERNQDKLFVLDIERALLRKHRQDMEYSWTWSLQVQDKVEVVNIARNIEHRCGPNTK